MKRFQPHPVTYLEDPVEEAKKVLGEAEKIIVFAGAGMSADVGVPVYWSGDDSKYGSNVTSYGYTHLEHAFMNLWSVAPEAQAQYFKDAWSEMMATSFACPTSPYSTLLNWLHGCGKEYFVVTTNVDNGFRFAGFDEKKIYEVHGSYRNSQCLQFNHGVFPTQEPNEGITLCPVCQSLARPNVLFFNDPFFNDLLLKKEHKRFQKFTHPIDVGVSEKYAVLEIGVGTKIARLRNATNELNTVFNVPTVRVNAFQTGLKDSPQKMRKQLRKPHIELAGTATEMLKTIIS